MRICRMWLVGIHQRAVGITTAAVFFLSLFFCQGILFIQANSQTFDEATHLAAGYSYLSLRDFRLDPEHPPLIKVLQALPSYLLYKLPLDSNSEEWREANSFAIGYKLLYKSGFPADQILFVSRVPNLFLGGALIALMGWWSFRLWGFHAAIVAIALGSLEPNIVAHSALVTTDVGVALFMFLTVYLLWEYMEKPKWRLLVLIGLSAGAAMASKYSGILLLAVLGCVIAAATVVDRPDCLLPSNDRQASAFQRLMQAAGLFLLIVVFAVPTISAAYAFQGVTPWFTGLREFLSITEAGRAAFFLGKYSHEGWWNYFLIAFLIKTPVGSLLLIALSLALRRAGNPLSRREAIFFAAPVLIIFAVTTQSKVNIGVRHILTVYPFLFVLASRLATVNFSGRRRVSKMLIAVPLLLTAFSSLRIVPHQLAYFNEFVGGPEQGYRYLSDSNLDWGQDLKGLKAYIDKENLPVIYLSYFGTASPSYYGIRYQYLPTMWVSEWPPPADRVMEKAPRKILAVSVYNLQDVSDAYDPLFRWLWSRQPVAKIGYSIFVYDLSEDREGLAKLEETYVKANVRLPP